MSIIFLSKSLLLMGLEIGSLFSILIPDSSPSFLPRHSLLQPTRLLCPWDSSGTNIGMGCHALLRGSSQRHGSSLSLSCPALAEEFYSSSTTWEAHGNCQLITNHNCSLLFFFFFNFILFLNLKHCSLLNFNQFHHHCLQ